MHDISFVITTRNNADTIAACVATCAQQRDVTAEVIVVDNHSDDGTPRLAEQAGADHVVTRGPERSAQRNHGVQLAASEVVVIVDSDMTVDPDVARQITTAFARRTDLGAVVIPELAAGDGWWAEARKLEKRMYLGDATVEAARGFRRAAYLQVGGYDEALVGAEDWDLPDRVAGAGWAVGRITAPVHHHETVTALPDLLRKKRYYGRGVAQYRRERGAGARPLVRSSLLSRPGELLRRPHITAFLAVIKTVEATGIAWGMRDHRRVHATP